MNKKDDLVTDRDSDRSAGVPPAVAGASRPRFGEVKIRNRGHQPHSEKDSATYFITLRLADSLPKSVLERISSERSSDERKKLRVLSAPVIERYLDRGAGAWHMRNSAVAEEIASSLRHFDDQRYRLFAWCVMPNHVHVVVRLFPGQTLAAVVHSWKSFSAKSANRILRLRGSFWQRECYDHLLRDEGVLLRAMRYVAENPVKAKLEDWKWVWGRGRDARATAAGDGGATKHVATKP